VIKKTQAKANEVNIYHEKKHKPGGVRFFDETNIF